MKSMSFLFITHRSTESRRLSGACQPCISLAQTADFEVLPGQVAWRCSLLVVLWGYDGIWSRFHHVYHIPIKKKKHQIPIKPPARNISNRLSHQKKQQIPIPEKKSGTGGCSSTTILGHISFRCTLGPRFLNRFQVFGIKIPHQSVGGRHLLTHSAVVLAKKTSLLWLKFPVSWFIYPIAVGYILIMKYNKWSTCNGHPRPQIHKFPSLAEIFGLGSITRFSCHMWDEHRKHLGWDSGDERTKSWIIFAW